MHLIPENVSPALLKAAIDVALTESRFTADTELVSGSFYNKRPAVKITRVRRHERREYCGQHPNACPVNPFFTKKHIHSHFLEGADWVGFNDMLNDICDENGWSVSIRSSSSEFKGVLHIRKGLLRRAVYRSYSVDLGHMTVWGWDTKTVREGDFVDRNGLITGPSEYPEGTPGDAVWRTADLQTV